MGTYALSIPSDPRPSIRHYQRLGSPQHRLTSRRTTLIGTWSGPFITCAWRCGREHQKGQGNKLLQDTSHVPHLEDFLENPCKTP